MAHILVNGLKSKVGGGRVLLDTYLQLLGSSTLDDYYFILTPDRSLYRHVESDRVKVIDIPRWAHSNFATVLLYRLIFPRLLARYRIDTILNFGDVIIPTDVPQLYLFDWAFAVYPDSLSWQRLGWKDKLVYRIKLYFFEAYLSRATLIMAQTDAMKIRLEKRYGLENVVMVPSAVPVSCGADLSTRAFDLPADTTTLIYPTNFYPHKNIEILAPVAALLKARGCRVTIATTLARDEHPDALAFLASITAKGLEDVLINVGRLPVGDIPALFVACDGLLMPTLLETFGLPYVEAMQHQKPILTSDLDFAHAVCGDAALYFNPEAPQSIADAIEKLLSDATLRRTLIDRGAAKFATMWSSSKVFEEYQRLLRQLSSCDEC